MKGMTSKKFMIPKGFTLIELLVVVAIISLLSSVVLASLNSARAKARDVKRLAELKQVQTALEFYFDDNGVYPNPGGGAWAHDCSGDTGWATLLGPALSTYLSTVPHDPLYTGNPWPYCYYYKLGDHPNCLGAAYTIVFATEVSNYNIKTYSTGEGGSFKRYCIQS
jgi:prepilin-type N-terminal cleavage/methylation domain-containing protein